MISDYGTNHYSNFLDILQNLAELEYQKAWTVYLD